MLVKYNFCDQTNKKLIIFNLWSHRLWFNATESPCAFATLCKKTTSDVKFLILLCSRTWIVQWVKYIRNPDQVSFSTKIKKIHIFSCFIVFFIDFKWDHMDSQLQRKLWGQCIYILHKSLFDWLIYWNSIDCFIWLKRSIALLWWLTNN